MRTQTELTPAARRAKENSQRAQVDSQLMYQRSQERLRRAKGPTQEELEENTRLEILNTIAVLFFLKKEHRENENKEQQFAERASDYKVYDPGALTAYRERQTFLQIKIADSQAHLAELIVKGPFTREQVDAEIDAFATKQGVSKTVADQQRAADLKIGLASQWNTGAVLVQPTTEPKDRPCPRCGVMIGIKQVSHSLGNENICYSDVKGALRTGTLIGHMLENGVTVSELLDAGVPLQRIEAYLQS